MDGSWEGDVVLAELNGVWVLADTGRDFLDVMEKRGQAWAPLGDGRVKAVCATVILVDGIDV